MISTIFWVIVSIIAILKSILQFLTAQRAANERNTAGVLWEGLLFFAFLNVAVHAWPF